MRYILRIALILIGLLMIGIGFGFLTNPATIGPDFGLSPIGNQGMSSLRGDFTAYFWVAGAALVLGAWRRNGNLLLVPVALLGITFAVRALSLVIDGPYDGWVAPMAVEAVTVTLAFIGSRMLPHTDVASDNN